MYESMGATCRVIVQSMAWEAIATGHVSRDVLIPH